MTEFLNRRMPFFVVLILAFTFVNFLLGVSTLMMSDEVEVVPTPQPVDVVVEPVATGEVLEEEVTEVSPTPTATANQTVVPQEVVEE